MALINRVLVVEDSTAIRQLLSSCIEAVEGIEVLAVSTLADAVSTLEKDTDFLCAVLDLTLPDAPNGEVVNAVQDKHIPIVILTASLESAVQRTMDSELVVDYITKRDINEIERVTSTVRNIYNNQKMKVLAVDDSKSFLDYMAGLLKNLRYSVITAENGRDALQKLADNPDTCLVISDYNMPEMDGIELVQEIRKKHRREEIAVLGLSSHNDSELITRFLKSGANDYMRKPLIIDEFYCRVFQNTNTVAYVNAIKEAATCDYLTRVSNRRHLFDQGERIYARACGGHTKIATIMIDADHFKSINDNFGHDAGDKVLVEIARTLKNTLRPTDIVARFGGEEFACIVTINKERDIAVICEKIRAAIEANVIDIGETTIEVTVSIGATGELGSSLDDMFKRADLHLYKAKQAGRNRSVAA